MARSVDVAAPAGTVWLALTDWPQNSRWMLGTRVHVVEGNGRSIGSRLVAFTGAAGVGFTDTMEITGWEPPARCTVRHVGPLVRGTGTFHVRSIGPQTSTVVWSEQLVLPLGPIGRLGWPVLRPAFGIGLQQSLRRLARFAESYSMGD